jgi:hypothetical protein
MKPLTKNDMDLLSWLAVKSDKTGKWESEPLCLAREVGTINPEQVQRMLARGLVAISDGYYHEPAYMMRYEYGPLRRIEGMRRASQMLSLTAEGLNLVQKVFG